LQNRGEGKGGTKGVFRRIKVGGSVAELGGRGEKQKQTWGEPHLSRELEEMRA